MKSALRFLQYVILALVLPCAEKGLFGQQPHPIRFAILDDYIRDQLAADWDLHKGDQPKMERAYCLGWQYDIWAGEIAYRVTQITSPDSVHAGPTGIRFSCFGKFPGHMAELHIHPSQTCLGNGPPCWDGGPYAFQCLASDNDRLGITNAHYPFGMVQCSREGVVAYFPFVTPGATPP